MHEISIPPLVTRPDIASTLALIQERAAQAPTHSAFSLPDQHREITLPEFLADVDTVAEGLLNAHIQTGERVGLIAATSYEWACAEYAIWRVGAVVVPIYETTPPATALELLTRADVHHLILGPTISTQFASAEEWKALPGGILMLEELFQTQPTPGSQAVLDERTSTIARTDLATIVFTSGTTGEPKGTRITHANFIDLVLNVHAAWGEVLNDRGRTVIFLPLSHVLARGLQMICMYAGMHISYFTDPHTLLPALPQLHPTFLVVVPRVVEKVLEAIASQAKQKHCGWLWKRAFQAAVDRGKALENAATAPTTAFFRLADRLFYRRIRLLFGGHIQFLLSGSAPLSREHSLAFRGMGLPIMEGYGLTETTAPAAGNQPGQIRSGTVGTPIPGTTIRIDDAGEVLISGIGVADGYLDADQTAAAFTDGFFHTGDLGHFDADGYLHITGRSKDILITAGGKNVSPVPWETSMELDPLITHAVMVGDGRPFLSALLLLDAGEVRRFLRRGGHGALTLTAHREVTNEALLTHLHTLMNRANASVSRAESVKKVRALLVEATEENGLLTPIMKVKRVAVTSRFAHIIEDMYAKRRTR